VIIEFKSKAAGSFFMTEPVAQMVFAAIGAELTPKGIFTEDQVPVIRARLAAAIQSTRAQDRDALNLYDETQRESAAPAAELPVGLSQRAFPLLDMLAQAEKKKVSVVWGV
jgi:hypothetical protein